MSRMARIRPSEPQNAIDSGIVVSFIQNASRTGRPNTNAIPEPAASEERPARPRSRSASVSATWTGTRTVADPVSMRTTAPDGCLPHAPSRARAMARVRAWRRTNVGVIAPRDGGPALPGGPILAGRPPEARPGDGEAPPVLGGASTWPRPAAEGRLRLPGLRAGVVREDPPEVVVPVESLVVHQQ